MKSLQQRLVAAASATTAPAELAELAADPDADVRAIAKRNRRTPAAARQRTGRLRRRDQHLSTVRRMLHAGLTPKAIIRGLRLPKTTVYRLVNQVKGEGPPNILRVAAKS